MERINVSIIGTAHPHSHAYQETLTSMKNVNVTCLLDDGGRIHERLTGAQRCQGLDELLEKGDFEVAFVFVSNDRVADVCDRLIGAAKHVFCEKPGPRTAREMRALAERVRQAGVRFCTGYQWRLHPIPRYIKGLVQSGLLGTVRSVEARMVTTDVDARNPDHYLFQRERSGGGIVHWLGCHHIDLLRFLLDDDVTELCAFVDTVTRHPIDVEDLASASLRFAQGTLATLHQGYLIPSNVGDAYMNSSYDAYLALRGPLGWIRWDQMTGVVEAYSTAPDWDGAPYRKTEFGLTKMPGYGWAGHKMAASFVAAVDGSGPIPADEDDALRTLEIIEAIYRSAASKKVEAVRP